MKLLLLLPFAAAAKLPLIMTWADWKAHFGVAFNGEDEDAARKAIYDANVAFIKAENGKKLAYTLGVNQFSSLAQEEFLAQYTGARSDDLSSRVNASPGKSEAAMEPRVDSVDWTTKEGVVNPVKDQGNCGSCWAFSVVGVVESAYALSKGKLYSLSEQQLLDCEDYTAGGCNGGLPSKAMDYLKTSGLGYCSEESYPYKARDFSDDRKCQAGASEHGRAGVSNCTFDLAPGVITGFTSVAGNAAALEAALMTQPISVTVDADHLWHSYRSGVLSRSCPFLGQINHAVIAVGYDADSFKIRNSWGPSWGEAGYVRIAKNVSNPYCLFKQSPIFPTLATALIVV